MKRDRDTSYIVVRQHTCWLLFLYFVAGMASAWAQAGSLNPFAEMIIGRMAQAQAENRTRLRPYVDNRTQPEMPQGIEKKANPIGACLLLPQAASR